MTLTAHIKNGMIVPDDPIQLPEGAVVQVEIVTTSENPPAAALEVPSLLETLKPIIGAAKGLPADLSINHDHYLYGTPKRA